MAEKLIVTSALPYANGPIHFGHVVGAYLPADIYVRFRRMCGDDVHFVCGTDEHGVAITLRAEQEGTAYEDYVNRWQTEIKRTLDSVGIEFDIFSGTAHHHNPYHRELSQQFFQQLLDNGYLQERVGEYFFSPQLQRFLPDRYVEGTCYICGHDGARGDECPSCGEWLEAKKLKDPRSTLDGSTPELRPSRHWSLDLPKIRDEWLQQWFEAKSGRWKVNVEKFVRSNLANLREREITRDLPWGVPVPLPDTDGKVLYVWFEAPIGYLSISKQYFEQRGDPQGFEALWKDPATKLLHFIGKDNITFHVVTFPSMLYATHAGWVVPDNVPANEFFNLEGDKFNTSRGWYIPADSTAARVPTDALRYALAMMMPETADSDWSWREFQARVNDELADNLGNFVARTLRFTDRFFGGVLTRLGTLSDADQAILAAGTSAAREVGEHLRAFGYRKACQRLMAFCSACNKYYDEQQPWASRKTDPARCQHTIRVCAELVRSLAILCTPVMPATSASLLAALGIDATPRWSDAGGVGLRDAEISVEPQDVLFPKIPDEDIELELEELQKMREARSDAPEPESPSGDPIKPSIEFEAFTAVDLRAGRVVAAEKHPKADRLLVLRIDLGVEQRTICSGLAEVYTPDELVGRDVVVAANLKARKLRGIESQGMVLTTEDADGVPRILEPAPGTPRGGAVQ